MKRKVLAVLTFAGVLGVSSASLADVNFNVDIDQTKFKPIAKSQNQLPPEPPEGFNGKRPPMMSGDKRPPMPPSGDRQGPKDGKRPPMSGDKRPHRPRSDDRRPPEFERQ